MAIALKALLYFGVTLLLGAGLYQRFVTNDPSKAAHKLLKMGALVGASLVILASVLEVVRVVTELMAGFYPALTLEYLLVTRHGAMTLLRLALILLLLGLEFGPRLPKGDNVIFSLLFVAILATISWVSHAAAMGSPLAVVADVLHMSAAVIWLGSLCYFAWLTDSRQTISPAIWSTIRRMSGMAAVAVILVSASGIYAATLHLDSFEQLFVSAYGLSLSYKVVLLLFVLMLAALNRFILMRMASSGDLRPLVLTVRLEVALLFLILLLSAVLTNQDPMHELQHHF